MFKNEVAKRWQAKRDELAQDIKGARAAGLRDYAKRKLKGKKEMLPPKPTKDNLRHWARCAVWNYLYMDLSRYPCGYSDYIGEQLLEKYKQAKQIYVEIGYPLP